MLDISKVIRGARRVDENDYVSGEMATYGVPPLFEDIGGVNKEFQNYHPCFLPLLSKIKPY